MLLLLWFVLQKDEDSSTSLEDDDVGASVEEVPIEITVSQAAAVEATTTVEPTDNVTAATETAGDIATILDAFEEEVIAVEVAAEMAVKESKGDVTASIAGGDGLTQGGSSRSGDYADSVLLDLSRPTRSYVRRSHRVNVVSSNSKRTPSVSATLLTPRASQSESAGVSSMHVTPATPPIAVDAPLGAPAAENIQGDEEDVAIPDHISDIDVDLATKGVTTAGVVSAVEVPEVKHIESKV